ncbi:GDSL-type esterase/lipase family protein [Symbioplanes lichenis]|uniref:GDSL-type esterase/lipase family protein n=1 Tax=Symbioplanes lichenis TaxID=1629072 RepID=UPI0027390329|nr:GDSL-type esterase/lipase family protein [Actinoplanes lichenis]
MHSTPITAELVRGARELERTERGLLPHRLPAWARAQTPDPQLALVEAQPSGVRVVFRTRATTVELETVPTKRVFAGLAPRPDGRYDLVVDGRLTATGHVDGGDVVRIDLATGSSSRVAGAPGTVTFAGLTDGPKTVEIWLPHNETTELVGLRTDAPVEPAPDPGRPVWLHHGSSISQGSDAAGPSVTWPAVAAAARGFELINLGLGGSALLDPFTARTMRDAPADLISVEIGINLVNTDVMRLRAFTPAVHGFLDTIRDGHPAAPLVVISPLYCPAFEDTPGPGAFDVDALRAGRIEFVAAGSPGPGKLTLRVIRDELTRIVADRADPMLSYVDGLDLYGERDHDELPLPDRLHPDAATHLRVGARFAELAFGAE